MFVVCRVHKVMLVRINQNRTEQNQNSRNRIGGLDCRLEFGSGIDAIETDGKRIVCDVKTREGKKKKREDRGLEEKVRDTDIFENPQKNRSQRFFGTNTTRLFGCFCKPSENPCRASSHFFFEMI